MLPALHASVCLAQVIELTVSVSGFENLQLCGGCAVCMYIYIFMYICTLFIVIKVEVLSVLSELFRTIFFN